MNAGSEGRGRGGRRGGRVNAEGEGIIDPDEMSFRAGERSWRRRRRTEEDVKKSRVTVSARKVEGEGKWGRVRHKMVQSSSLGTIEN